MMTFSNVMQFLAHGFRLKVETSSEMILRLISKKCSYYIISNVVCSNQRDIRYKQIIRIKKIYKKSKEIPVIKLN